ncbi:hypothetical protein BDY21DRAFT_342428 [Lineolata rhizophorae]|uniref:Pex N-terminal domain-containing protein n=1 Tax=Lineolata rhizophorae TaxID=578093 RepID=A0A6A6P348_9PEZI|nr:hypothetical protein BDY21DRAFT_342428 [Lineolata rhizophorae]
MAAALRAALFKLTVWDHDASYGAALQGLRYVDARAPRGVEERKRPGGWQKGVYGLVSVGGRYAWSKWEDWLLDQESGYGEVGLVLCCCCSLTPSSAQLFIFLHNTRLLTLSVSARSRSLPSSAAPPASRTSPAPPTPSPPSPPSASSSSTAATGRCSTALSASA